VIRLGDQAELVGEGEDAGEEEGRDAEPSLGVDRRDRDRESDVDAPDREHLLDEELLRCQPLSVMKEPAERRYDQVQPGGDQCDDAEHDEVDASLVGSARNDVS
jgi:hypothetical protein